MRNRVLPCLVALLGIIASGTVAPSPARPETSPLTGLEDLLAAGSPEQAPNKAAPNKATPNKATGTCVASTTTLCIDDQPGDRRFEVSVDFDTALNGGTSGQGKALPLSQLGIRRGGLFWFFDPTNPELLIKILDGCSITGHYWVFWSAGTTVGLELTVNDTFTGRTKVYLDPDATTALPVTDTGAFACP